MALSLSGQFERRNCRFNARLRSLNCNLDGSHLRDGAYLAKLTGPRRRNGARSSATFVSSLPPHRRGMADDAALGAAHARLLAILASSSLRLSSGGAPIANVGARSSGSHGASATDGAGVDEAIPCALVGGDAVAVHDEAARDDGDGAAVGDDGTRPAGGIGFASAAAQAAREHRALLALIPRGASAPGVDVSTTVARVAGGGHAAPAERAALAASAPSVVAVAARLPGSHQHRSRRCAAGAPAADPRPWADLDACQEVEEEVKERDSDRWIQAVYTVFCLVSMCIARVLYMCIYVYLQVFEDVQYRPTVK